MTKFIKKFCIVNPDYSINASEFRNALMTEMKIKIQQKELIDLMTKRGFIIVNSNGRVYKGLRFKNDDDEL